MPFGFCPDDRVENGEKLAEAGDDCDFLWPAALNEALVGGFDDGIVPNGDECGHVQDVADAASSAADHAMAAPCAQIFVEWRDADESGQLAAIERAEFGQFGDEGSRGYRANARHGGQEIFRLAPGGRGADAVIDIDIDVREFFFQKSEMAVDFLGEALVGGAPAAIGLHADHLDDLPPPGDEFAEHSGFVRGDRPRLRPDPLREQGDDLRIDGVGLGELSERPGEIPAD